MTRQLVASALFLFLVSCATTESTQQKEEKPAVKDTSTPVTIQTGWVDPDTYTVKVTDATEGQAQEKAKLRILKDIVNVRVMNGSKYTDIEKIKEEFEPILESGKVISSRKIAGGVEIYYQVRSKGLREKFRRE